MMNTTAKMTQLHSFTEQQLCSENVRQSANQVVRARNDPYDSKVSSQMSKCSNTNPSCTWPIGIAPKRHQGINQHKTLLEALSPSDVDALSNQHLMTLMTVTAPAVGRRR